jgi:hypothetical protein
LTAGLVLAGYAMDIRDRSWKALWFLPAEADPFPGVIGLWVGLVLWASIVWLCFRMGGIQTQRALASPEAWRRLNRNLWLYVVAASVALVLYPATRIYS